jgi:hypothetical protein
MKLKSLIVSVVLALTLACVTPGNRSEKYIELEQTAVEWLAPNLTDEAVELAKDKGLPDIFYVEDAVINKVALDDCLKSGGTQEACSADIETVAGKFYFETQDIYIKTSYFETLSDCAKTALIVHELVHFYQFNLIGDWRGNMLMHFMAEQEASNAQYGYMNNVCPEELVPKEEV